MGLFSKSSSALCMLGSIEVVKAIIESQAFDAYSIELVPRDFATIDELIQGVRETKKAKYVFISDTALIGIEDGKYEVIKRIRESHPDITIVMFFNDEKRDEIYKNWAFGYKVYHLYYSDNNGGYDFEKIAGELSNPQMPLSSETNVSQNEELNLKEAEIKKREKELKDKERELDALEKQLAEAQTMENTEETDGQIIFLKEQIKEMQRNKLEAEEKIDDIKSQYDIERQKLEQKHEKEKEEYYKKVDEDAKAQIEEIKQQLKSEHTPQQRVKTLGCITIGVFSISQGAGATFTSVNIGETLAMAGYPTAVVAYDGKMDLKYAGGDYAHYILPEKDNKKVTLLETINKGYNFVIQDFGCLFPISPLGELEIGKSKVSDKQEDIDELIRCNYKIAVGFSDSWHIGKLNFFIDNEVIDSMTSIYSISGFSNSKELQKCDLPMCERDMNTIIQVFFEWLGISRKSEQEPPKKKGIFGIKERMMDNR